MPRLLGLRNVVCGKEDWYYLVFYDIDNKESLTVEDVDFIDKTMKLGDMSYIVYKTKHGFHIISLTPVDSVIWGLIFAKLKGYFKSYYSGMTIRLSRKKDEIQALIKLNTTYGEVIPNLYNLYAQRFNYEKLPWQKEIAKYLLVFEKYRSVNE